MRPEPGQVLHFSEDPTIKTFAPHVAATAQQPEPYVWAVDARNSVTQRDHRSNFVDADLGVVICDLLFQELCNFVCVYLSHCFTFPTGFSNLDVWLRYVWSSLQSAASSSFSRVRRPRTEPSYTVLPTRTTTPPSRDGSSWKVALTCDLVISAI